MFVLKNLVIVLLVALPISSANSSSDSVYLDYLSSHKVYCLSGNKVIEVNSIQVCSNDYTGESFNSKKEAMNALARKKGTFTSANAAEELELVGSGTGFTVNPNYAVTANHVVRGCKKIDIRHTHTEYSTTVVATDPKNDLALLKIDNPIANYAKLRSGKPPRLGEVIAVYGYPLSGLLSKSANINQGNINSLAGAGNDSGKIQYDAATQPGNSGGPLLDSSGNVVGVISATISKKFADSRDYTPQNVNFAIKSYIVAGFLESNGVQHEFAESSQEYLLVDIAPIAEKFTVFVGCWE